MSVAVITMFFFEMLCAGSYAGECSGMAEYWGRFRQAALRGDAGQVASMTRFPFRVGGILDSDPVIMHDRRDFPRQFTKLLDQKVTVVDGSNKISVKTMLQLVKDKKTIAAKDFSTPCSVSVELFEFEYHNGKWHFTGAYLEE